MTTSLVRGFVLAAWRRRSSSGGRPGSAVFADQRGRRKDDGGVGVPVHPQCLEHNERVIMEEEINACQTACPLWGQRLNCAGGDRAGVMGSHTVAGVHV